MSQENVEVVRRAWEASLRHDNEAVFDLYDPRVEIVVQDSVEGPTTYVGVDGVREFFRDMLGVFDSLRSEVEEWIDAGDEVIAVMRNRARGRQSGVPVEGRDAHVWTVQNGKLRRLRIYPNKSEALKAVGLSE
jgi:ketosteroid isomerase-like protein